MRAPRGATPLLTLANPLLPTATTASITYDVAVLALSTSAGSHGTDAAESRQVIDRLDAEYARETGGAYRFRLASYTELPVAADHLCDLNALQNRYRSQIDAAMSGLSQSATWVIVTPSGPCNYPGVAFLGTPGIHMNGFWQASPTGTVGNTGFVDVAVLAHEIGHNLGLRHASMRAANGTEEPLTGSAATIEYGDGTSIMGRNQRSVRFSAFELQALGLLPTSVVTTVQRSGTYAIVDANSSGKRLLVVPVSDTQSYYVEYRAGTGADSHLATGDDGYPNNAYGTGRGVQVRLVTTPARSFGAQAAVNGGRSVLLPNSGQPGPNGGYLYRTGLRPGTTLRLPGDITVTVESVTGTSARVRIGRPVRIF